MIRTTRTRRGVTLVEMMVAAAMSILGMWLLAWLYQQGLDNFRGARARADLAAQERMVVTLLTRDMKAPHFMDDDTKPNLGRRVSDQRLDLADLSGSPANPTVSGYVPPRGGYFRAGSTASASGNNAQEGYDDFPFSTSRSGDHFLQFTVILPGGPSDQLFSAQIPAIGGQQFFSTTAEVSYFLRPAGATPGGIPVFDLFRRQRLCAPGGDYVQAYAQAYTPAANQADAAEAIATALGVSGAPKIATLTDLTVPQPRPGQTFGVNSVRLPGGSTIPSTFAPLPITSNRFGEDKLMSNVLSFEVKFTGVAGVYSSGINAQGAPLGPLPWPAAFASGNTDFPYDTLPLDGLFDTHSQLVTSQTPTANNDWRFDVATQSIPNRTLKLIRITGAQIRLRGYDPSTRTTRQTTVTVDL
jgi:hypothetical protein